MTASSKNSPKVFVVILILVAVMVCAIAFAYRGNKPADRPSASNVTEPFVVSDGKAIVAQKEEADDSTQVPDSPLTNKAAAIEHEAPAPYEVIDQPDAVEDGSGTASEQATESQDDRLTIPEGADYVPDEVLIEVSPDATVEEVNALLAQTGSVVAREVSAEEIEKGYIRLEVAQGSSVEDAMNDLAESSVTEAAQPNYIYYALAGDESDLRERLDASFAPQPVEPEAMTGEEDSSAADSEGSDSDEHASSGESAQDTEAASSDDEATTDADDMAADGMDASGDETSPEAVEDAAVEGNATSDEEDPSDESEGTPTDGDLAAQDGEDVTKQDEEELGLQALADTLVKTNDPYLENQWALASMHVYEAWALAKCEHTVGVAVLDQGPDPTHEDLADNVVNTYDVVTKSSSISFTDDHGTVVSGIVSAVADNEIGVAGVSYNAGLVLINVMKEANGGYQTSSNLLRDAMQYVIQKADDYNIRVVNVSIGGAQSKPVTALDNVFKVAVDEAYAKGIVTVAAAGNADANGGTVPYYIFPADYENIVSVINLTRSGSTVVRASESNYNVDGQTAKNISAPGTSVLSTYNDNAYGSSLSGTSMAAPQVSGVLALEFAANPSLSAEKAVEILYDTAYESSKASGGIYDSSKTFDWNYTNFGWGEVNAFEAVKAAKEGAAEGQLPDITHLQVPLPKVKGASRIPIGATAAYTVTDGSIKIKSGGSYASLKGNTLTGLKAGTVTLSVRDAKGKERFTKSVTVYATTGTWAIESALDWSYVIDIQRASLENKGNAIIYQSNGKNNQVWLLQRQSDGAFVIRSGKSGKVLDVAGGSKSSGANVCQYALGTKSWQRWTMQVNADNTITFVNKNSGKVLEVNGNYASNGRNVRQATKANAARQRWYLTRVKADIGKVYDGIYRISTSINRNYVLEVYRQSTANGANVDLYRWNGGANQRWKIEYLGKDVYRITNVNSLRSLDVKGGKLGYSVNIAQWTWKNTGNQRWNLTRYADGSYAIVRAGTSWVMDVKRGKARNGANVQQYRRKNNSGQKWFLTQF